MTNLVLVTLRVSVAEVSYPPTGCSYGCGNLRGVVWAREINSGILSVLIMTETGRREVLSASIDLNS